jgi:predicted dehydrogenase
MPKRVAGFASIGKYHNIEVEDEVTGYFEYENGMVGHFITTTAESPGTNRLEIIGENGKLVFEDGRLTFTRNVESMIEFSKTSPAGFARVEYTVEDVPFTHHGEPGHRIILENFANAILGREPVMVPGEEGIRGLSLGNAIMLSSFLGHPVDLPLDEDAYEKKLLELISTSRYQKPAATGSDADLSASFSYH